MKREFWDEIIENNVIDSIKEFCSNNIKYVSTCFITGSYVRKEYNIKSPNVNIYFISKENQRLSLISKLSYLWKVIEEKLEYNNVQLHIDCHPYTLSFRDIKFNNKITLTTNVFDLSQNNEKYNLPTMGPGWMKNHEIIFGTSDDLAPLKQPLEKNHIWFNAVHEALTYYKNMLIHLPWALDWIENPYLLIEESTRYAEEALKDGINIALDYKELHNNKNLELLHLWQTQAKSFFEERYQDEGVWAFNKVDEMKKINSDTEITAEMAISIWEDSLKVWEIIWKKYCKQAEEYLGDSQIHLFKINNWI
ncbi:hypothetical protein NSQ82_03200 [Caldifermentibacillus hisashii]|uniref:hypothetical protein n=1 Tax=Caldifermentibacillus hisashii TaxID=996558 RepID=UPI0031B6DA9B